MSDAKREAEKITREESFLSALVHRDDLLHIENKIADALARAERQGYIRGLRDAANEYCSTVWTQEIALDIRAEADRLEKEHETKNP